MIITVGGIKGGTGKTTIAVHICIAMALAKKDVLLVDADDQGTATDFSALRSQREENLVSYTTIQLSGKAVRDQILKLKSKFDFIIIDTGGRDTASQRAALSVSDVLLIPLAPRSFDVWTIDLISSLIEEIIVINPSLKAFSFLNRADVRGSENNTAQSIISEKPNINMIPIIISNRKAFSDTCAMGKSVIETYKNNLKAFKEINNLISFILDYNNKKNT